MNLRKIVLIALVCLSVPAMIQAAERTLTGELVILDSSRDRFRLVDHGGSFRAPAGVSLEAFDGKPVEVEIGRNGQVISIAEMEMHIEPIAHGYEVISGQLQLNDPSGGSFSIAGDPRTYRAPTGLDVRPYANRMVEIRLDEAGRVSALTPRGGAIAADAPLAPAGLACTYNGQAYSDGAPICQGNTQFRCERGQWRNLGTACP